MSYGCACEWCGRTYEMRIWQQPFWCWKCVEGQLKDLNAKLSRQEAA